MWMFNPILEGKEVRLEEKAINMHLGSHFWIHERKYNEVLSKFTLSFGESIPPSIC